MFEVDVTAMKERAVLIEAALVTLSQECLYVCFRLAELRHRKRKTVSVDNINEV